MVNAKNHISAHNSDANVCWLILSERGGRVRVNLASGEMEDENIDICFAVKRVPQSVRTTTRAQKDVPGSIHFQKDAHFHFQKDIAN